MAYIIYNNDNTVLLTLADGDVDSVTTSLDLVGKNVNNYGQYVNNNLTKLLSSFASPVGEEPRSPQIGQLWFNKTLNRLTVFDGASFKPTYGATISGTRPVSTSTGDMWYDELNSQLKVWNGTDFKLVGPAVSGLFGKFGVEPPVVPIQEDNFSQAQNVSVVYSYGEPTALITTASFSMSVSSATVYLGTANTSTIVKGVTILDDLDVRGDLYVNGLHKLDKSLTFSWGLDSPVDPLSSNANLEASNSALEDVLDTLFTTTNYAPDSEIKVFATYNTWTHYTTSVRHFRLEKFPTANDLNWRPYDLYATPYIPGSTLTNVQSTFTVSTPVVNLTGYYLEESVVNPISGPGALGGSNSRISDHVLRGLLPVEIYAKNSEARVVSVYNSSTFRVTSVRHFKLNEVTPGVLGWEPYNLYPNGYIDPSNLTNVISTATWVY